MSFNDVWRIRESTSILYIQELVSVTRFIHKVQFSFFCKMKSLICWFWLVKTQLGRNAKFFSKLIFNYIVIPLLGQPMHRAVESVCHICNELFVHVPVSFVMNNLELFDLALVCGPLWEGSPQRRYLLGSLWRTEIESCELRCRSIQTFVGNERETDRNCKQQKQHHFVKFDIHSHFFTYYLVLIVLFLFKDK
jgi:hypothetical protein